MQPKKGIRDSFLEFLKTNWGSLILFSLILGYAAYQRYPAYVNDRKYLGRPAPDFELRSVDGKRYRLSDLRGKKVLINFWATWCVPCRVEMPLLVKMYGELPKDSFEMLAVASEEEGTVRHFLEEHPVNYPVLVDDRGEAAQLYEVSIYPGFVFVDEKGNITEIDHGMNLFMRWKVRWKVTGSPF